VAVPLRSYQGRNFHTVIRVRAYGQVAPLSDLGYENERIIKIGTIVGLIFLALMAVILWLR
jgi:hypothetical protein